MSPDNKMERLVAKHLKKIEKLEKKQDRAHAISFRDPFGRTHVIDFGDADKEQALALKLQERAEALLERYSDNPEMLDRLFRVENAPPLTTNGYKPVELHLKLTQGGCNSTS